jgi:hypothetical protein
LTAPKSMTPSRPVRQQPEVAGVRVGVQQPGEHRTRQQEAGEQQRGPVALLRGPVADDPRERDALHPLGDQHPLGAGHDLRDADLLVAVVRRGEGLLRLGLEAVVELLGDRGLELLDERLDVEARG